MLKKLFISLLILSALTSDGAYYIPWGLYNFNQYIDQQEGLSGQDADISKTGFTVSSKNGLKRGLFVVQNCYTTNKTKNIDLHTYFINHKEIDNIIELSIPDDSVLMQNVMLSSASDSSPPIRI